MEKSISRINELPMNSLNLPIHDKGRLRPGTFFAFLIVSLYYISLLGPPLLHLPTLKWYFALGLGIAAFLINKRAINIHAARPYLVIYGLSLFGALLSLLNASLFSLALLNTIGDCVNFIVFLSFIPIFANQKTRKYLLFLISILALLWTFNIQLLLHTHSILIYSTFSETGANKNSAGFVLSLAAILLLYFAIFWEPNRKIAKQFILIARVFSFGIVVYFTFCLSLIYDRSSVLSLILGIVTISLIIFIKSRNKLISVLSTISFIVICILFFYILLPDILKIAPAWLQQFGEIQQQGISAFPSRLLLIQKGLYLIKQNPLFGIGLGNTKFPISTLKVYFPDFYIHNAYLTQWAERGIFGIVSYVIWIVLYLKTLKQNFFVFTITDQIWFVLFLLTFFSMIFADNTSVGMAMLAVLSGIWYEKYNSKRSINKTI